MVIHVIQTLLPPLLCSRDFAILCYCHDYYTGWFSYGKAALMTMHGLMDIDSR